MVQLKLGILRIWREPNWFCNIVIFMELTSQLSYFIAETQPFRIDCRCESELEITQHYWNLGETRSRLDLRKQLVSYRQGNFPVELRKIIKGKGGVHKLRLLEIFWFEPISIWLVLAFITTLFYQQIKNIKKCHPTLKITPLNHQSLF